MKVAILSSGGKDSSAAIWWAQCKGWDIKYFVTMVVTGGDSMMFQVPGTHLVAKQAKLCDTDWISIETLGNEETEISDLENTLKKLDIDGIVSGALRSDYQKNRLERMCERLGIKSFTPLWHQSPEDHMRNLISNGFKVMISGVSSEDIVCNRVKMHNRIHPNDYIRLSKNFHLIPFWVQILQAPPSQTFCSRFHKNRCL